MALTRKNSRILAEAVCVAALLTQSMPASASLPRKAPAQETYPATETEGSAPDSVVMPSSGMTRVQAPQTLSRPVLAAPATRPTAQPRFAPRLTRTAVMPRPTHNAPTIAAVTSPASESPLAYDPVPSDQTEALGKRLQLVDTIIRRHGRAYDYRSHTVHDLEKILSQLDAASPPFKAASIQKPPQAAGTVSNQSAAPSAPIPTEEDESNGTGENPHNTDY